MRKHFVTWLFLIIVVSGFLFLTAPVYAQFGFIEHTVSDTFHEASSICGADLDNDGDMDILAGGVTTGATSWFENDGSMSFTEHVLSSVFSPRDVKVADMDGDSDLDPVAVSWDDSGIHWWENMGDGQFEEHAVTDDLPEGHTIDLADYDDDGDIDILCAAFNSGFFWFENDGDAQFSEHLIGGVGRGTTCILGRDLDTDGDCDVIGVCYAANSIYWYEDGETQTTVVSGLGGAHWIDVADFDGDGDNDIICAAYLQGTVEYIENIGSQIFVSTTVLEFQGTSWIQAIDMDLDGDFDILVSAEIADEIKWLENMGPGEFVAHDIGEGFDQGYGAHGLDFDLDGDIDVLGAADAINWIAWWENDTGMAKAVDVQVTPNHGLPLQDTVQITASIMNPDTNYLQVSALYASMDDAVSETVELYDDGQHGDGEAEDNCWGAGLLLPEYEDVYAIDVIVDNLDTGESHPLRNAACFTTIGPVIFDHLINVSSPDTIPNPGERMMFLLELRNSGVSGTASQVSSTVTIQDTLMTFSDGSSSTMVNFPDLDAGEADHHSGVLMMDIHEEFPPDTDIHLEVTTSLYGHPFWTETVLIHVYGESGTVEQTANLPSEFRLLPPYPNPFNSQTRISVELPSPSRLTIEVFDLLGREVVTIAHGRYNAGLHDFLFHPNGLGSGVYYVHVETLEYGDAIQKIILVK